MEISKEYAAALFSLACENQTEQSFADALDTVCTIFRETPEYIEFLASPGIPKEERTAALEEAFASAVPEYVLSFLKVLCERGNIRSLNDCVKAYHQLLDVQKQFSRAKIISAVPLTDQQKERLKQKLEQKSGHTILPEYLVDPTLLGGMVVEMDGSVIDGSLQYQLQQVKEVIR